MAIALDVANVGQGESDSSTTVALTTGATVAVGARLFVGVGADVSGATITVNAISGGGLTWVIEGTQCDTTIGFGATVALCYADCPAGLASGATITATFNSAPFNAVIVASSYTGLDTVVRDVERTDTLAAAASWTTGSLTTSQANELVITAMCARQPGVALSNTATSGVEDQDFDGATQGELIVLQRRIEASPGSYTLAGTINTTPDSVVAVTAAYKEATAVYTGPEFVQAGTGVAVTTGTSAVSITGATAGDFLILHVVEDGTTADWGGATFTNVESLDGTDSDWTFFVADSNIGAPTALHSLIFMRAIANGTVSADVAVGASGNDLYARMYEFSGVSTGTTLASVVENGAEVDWVFHENNTGTTVSDAQVITNAGNRLAIQMIGLNDDLALAAFTGETGGDWTEPVAEFASATGTQATLGIQTAEMASAGTINGGTITITSAGWGVLGFALMPDVVVGGYQRIYGPAQLSTTAATLYTAPANTIVEIRRIWINNPSAGTIKPTLSIGTDGATTRYLELEDILAGGSYDGRRRTNHTLVGGEVLQGKCDTAATAVITIDAFVEAV